MGDTLNPAGLAAALKSLPAWTASANDTALTKTFSFADFDDSLRFVNAVATLARAQNHHPDIDIRYDTVTLTLSTHSAGGVTGADVALATAIEKIEP